MRPRRSAVSTRLPNVAAAKRESGEVIATIMLDAQNPTGAPTRIKFQRLPSNSLLSLFKKLLVLTPILLQGLHTLSLAKAVPDSVRDREYKRAVLCECPPVPHIDENDPVQETASPLKDQHLKTMIGEDTTLHLSI